MLVSEAVSYYLAWGRGTLRLASQTHVVECRTKAFSQIHMALRVEAMGDLCRKDGLYAKALGGESKPR